MSGVASHERVVEAEPARGAATPAPDREDRARKSSYSRRFAVIYMVLALVTGIAVGAFIVVALRDRRFGTARRRARGPLPADGARRARGDADRRAGAAQLPPAER